jgi:hypothetical protein
MSGRDVVPGKHCLVQQDRREFPQMGGGGFVEVARAAAAGLMAAVAAVMFVTPAAAGTLLTSQTPMYDWYVGGGAFMDHHTGFVPNTNNMYNVEKYEPGGKVFFGYHFDRDWSAEFSVDYFGETSFFEKGFPTESKERSFAVTGSVLWFTPAVSTWMPFYNDVMPSGMVPIRLFARGAPSLQEHPPGSLRRDLRRRHRGLRGWRRRRIRDQPALVRAVRIRVRVDRAQRPVRAVYRAQRPVHGAPRRHRPGGQRHEHRARCQRRVSVLGIVGAVTSRNSPPPIGRAAARPSRRPSSG